MHSHRFSTPRGPFSLAELAQISGAELLQESQGSFMVSDIATLADAQSTNLAMLHQKKYLKALKHSLAGACILAPEYKEHAPEQMHLLLHKNPYKAYALIAQLFYPLEQTRSFIAASAYVSSTALIGSECQIEHGAFIGDRARIGARCKIGVNSYIGEGVILGDDCHIENNVSISNTLMGNKVIVYPGARIGQDGFGFASDEYGHYKIPHRGGVIIGNDVEIGANTCIDRGSLDNTVIGDFCRLDNLIQIGHNVKVGRGSIIVAQVGIAGSTELGDCVTLSGQVGVIGHLKIGSKANILFGSKVLKDVPPGAREGGFPAMPSREWLRQIYSLKKESGRGNIKNL
ncbi:UDP-3-O-[3-hydroxymyristoyl] glucosamine N-acyltransferase [Legionella moravica]|uniref:UDP-3-O-acylglucosamine N-acyltransferase n=1 Tax=Legionella moravica TaxID=39962 RepID=A0A378K376_9GAMM|nr:UDP-3-O-(3-hydroxymyristoyl)glucosamine N-acyltransferase [Legionella moravica]KTD34424.1 UDP-3-O-[3-hydroxymyristoyl] glucosamine N-acyltransferase [Legionella moravica]STX64142.1 UDP-3-O-[3-hydroxymyristoyl] glucosamine N-acyltransferase [Legionella moravica]